MAEYGDMWLSKGLGGKEGGGWSRGMGGCVLYGDVWLRRRIGEMD